MNNLYYLIRKEWSNGFPYVSCALYRTLADAIKANQEVKQKNLEYDYGNGNKVEYELVSEEDMVHLIQKRVDESTDKCYFKHIGVEDKENYTIDVPKRDVEWDARIKDGNEEVTVDFIERRPADPEEGETGEVIYDVFTTRYYGKDDEEGSTYVDSLDCVSPDILTHIYCDFCGM